MAMAVATSHAVIFRAVVLPSSPQTPAYWSSTFFPIVLLARQSNQSPLRHCLVMCNQIHRYNVHLCISHDWFSSEILVFPVRRFFPVIYRKISSFLTKRC